MFWGWTDRSVIKSLLHKHKDLSWIPKAHTKSMLGIPQLERWWRQEDLLSRLLASLALMSSKIWEFLYPKKVWNRGKQEEEGGDRRQEGRRGRGREKIKTRQTLVEEQYPRWASALYTHTCNAHLHTRTNTHNTCIHIHMHQRYTSWISAICQINSWQIFALTL